MLLFFQWRRHFLDVAGKSKHCNKWKLDFARPKRSRPSVRHFRHFYFQNRHIIISRDDLPVGIRLIDGADSSSWDLRHQRSSDRFEIKHNDSDVKLAILSNGNVGIGGSNPNEKLHVVGNVKAAAFLNSSDRRYKRDITVLPNVLEKLEQINGVSYYWKTDEFPENGFDDAKQIGVIAQELEAVYPELVITDAAGYKTVDYPKLTAILIEAVKEQQSESKNLQDRVEIIEALLGVQTQK